MKRVFYALTFCAALLLLSSTALAADTSEQDSMDYYHIPHSSHDETWTAWTNDTALPTQAGRYYLETDVTISKPASLDGEFVLCLNGHHLTLNALPYFTGTTDDLSLAIEDCNQERGSITNASFVKAKNLYFRNLTLKETNSAFYINDDQTLTMEQCDLHIVVEANDAYDIGYDLFARNGFCSSDTPASSCVNLQDSTISITLDVSKISEPLEGTVSIDVLNNLENSTFSMNRSTLAFSCTDDRYHARISNRGNLEITDSVIENMDILNDIFGNSNSSITAQHSKLHLGENNGIHNELGHLQMTDVEFSGNSIANEGGNISIASCEIDAEHIYNGFELDGTNKGGVITIDGSTINASVSTDNETTLFLNNTSVSSHDIHSAILNLGTATIENCAISANDLLDAINNGTYHYNDNSAAISNKGLLTIKGGSVEANAQSGVPIACIVNSTDAVITLEGTPTFNGGLAHFFLFDMENANTTVPVELGTSFVAPANTYTIAGKDCFLSDITGFQGMVLVKNVDEAAKNSFQLLKVGEGNGTSSGVLTYREEEKTLVIGGCENGHTFEPWVTVVEATNTTDGKQQRICSVCGYKETRIIPATGNNGGGNSGGGGGSSSPAVKPAGTTPEPELPVLRFTDVSSSAYYYNAVAWAVDSGITSGTSANTFSPDNACSRAQVITFLWRMAGSPVVTSTVTASDDVPADSYYWNAVQWATANGITAGIGSGLFGANSTCTRGQMAALLYRYAGSPAIDGELPFADVSADSYYAKAVIWAAENGITNGVSETTFAPDNICTRAQIVAFLYRAFANR